MTIRAQESSALKHLRWFGGIGVMEIFVQLLSACKTVAVIGGACAMIVFPEIASASGIIPKGAPAPLIGVGLPLFGGVVAALVLGLRRK
jgi:hypothetical protein